MKKLLIFFPASIYILLTVGLSMTASAQGIWIPQQLQTSRTMFDVCFVDTNHGWAVGRDQICHTYDGGEIWQCSKSEVEFLHAVFFIDSAMGWVAGWDVGIGGVILKTTNGGLNWTKIHTVLWMELLDIYFVDRNHGWVVGGEFAISLIEPAEGRRMILSTYDGGVNWEIQLDEPASGPPDNIAFTDIHTGWALCQPGTLFYTTNGGETWSPVEIKNPNGRTTGFHFVDEREGWIIGEHGFIVHTTDGGFTWETQESNTQKLLEDITFINSEEGWVIGDHGLILHTTDGGETWLHQKSNTAVNLWAISFISRYRGWAVGRLGTVLKYTKGVKGDVNGDGEINVTDVVRVVDIMLGLPPDPSQYELWAADFNEDDEVNVLDVVLIIRQILSLTHVGK